MSQNQITIETQPELLLQYPYEPLPNVFPCRQDYCDRSLPWLFSSLSCFAQRLLSNAPEQLHSMNEFEMIAEEDIERYHHLITDTTTVEDFSALAPKFLQRTKHSSVMPFQCLDKESDQLRVILLQSFHGINYQSVMIHCISRDQWIIFLLMPWYTRQEHKGVIEIYCVGAIEQDQLQRLTSKLAAVLSLAFGRVQFTFRLRFKVPPTFQCDPLLLVFVLAWNLNNQGPYRDLNTDMISTFKYYVLQDFVKLHDNWLGRLQLTQIKSCSHPFITHEFQGKDNLQPLEDHGWMVIDVLGDGNCGYYSCILGLQNTGNNQYSAATSNTDPQPMSKNPDCQSQILRLRTDLKNHSDLLLRTRYPPGSRTHDWWMSTQAITDDEMDQLSTEFLDDDLNPSDYFIDDFKDNTEHQMNPFWATVVLASYFNMRVIVIIRDSSPKDNKQVEYKWSTRIVEARAPIDDHNNEHISNVMFDDIIRIPDVQFLERPTVELLFLTGYKEVGVLDNQHFQFLRRVICDGVPKPDIPSTTRCNDSLDTCLDRLVKEQNVSGDEQSTTRKSTITTGKGKGKRSSPSKGKSSAKRNEKKTTSAKGNPPTLDEDYFDQQFRDQSGKHKQATRMRYDSATGTYYTCQYDQSIPGYTKAVEAVSVEQYDESLVIAANNSPGLWVGCSIGDAGDEDAPQDIITPVKVLYQQHNQRYCLTYSLASALYHCKRPLQAEILASQAKVFSKQHFDQALSSLKDFMKNLVPEIGLPTVYGIRTKGHSRKKRHMTWHRLFTEYTPYPTIVVPVMPDGSRTHAFCVIDDLIFDSSTSHALQLKRESVLWIFNDVEVDISLALRFNTKFSPPGGHVEKNFTRTIEYHWMPTHTHTKKPPSSEENHEMKPSRTKDSNTG